MPTPKATHSSASNVLRRATAAGQEVDRRGDHHDDRHVARGLQAVAHIGARSCRSVDRAPPGACRPPRPRAARRCGAPRTWPPRTAWPTPPDRPAPPRARASPPRPPRPPARPSAARSGGSSTGPSASACLLGAPRRRASASLGVAGGGSALGGSVGERAFRPARCAGRRRARMRPLRTAHAGPGTARIAGPPGARRARARTRASRRRSCAASGPRPRPCACRPRRAARDRGRRAGSRPGSARSASSSASRLSMSRWLVGSSRISTLAAGGADEHRQRQAPALAAGEPVQGLLGLLAGEQEAPEQRARLVRRQARGALRASSTLWPGWPPAPSSSACWER